MAWINKYHCFYIVPNAVGNQLPLDRGLRGGGCWAIRTPYRDNTCLIQLINYRDSLTGGFVSIHVNPKRRNRGNKTLLEAFWCIEWKHSFSRRTVFPRNRCVFEAASPCSAPDYRSCGFPGTPSSLLLLPRTKNPSSSSTLSRAWRTLRWLAWSENAVRLVWMPAVAPPTTSHICATAGDIPIHVMYTRHYQLCIHTAVAGNTFTCVIPHNN